ncbi:helix-turn-helix domain-containing protein [Leptospira bandrabouensis]|uniref:XRE family transcriptional regulator n=1 Tax=Leptospira bandrabouensis TaxID=2484903 RepID=A0A6H3NR29_9LEPT|nr:XRE family transcriptional regulator [Leptospira bandrabouensis]
MRISETKDELIKQLRIQIRMQGLSVRDVAIETGVSKTSIQNLLTMNPPKVSLEILLHIAKIYNVPYRFEHTRKN